MSVTPPDPAGHHIFRRPPHRLSRSEKVIALALFFGVVLLVLVPFTFFVIPSGHVGVLYRLLSDGTETAFAYREGIGIKWPWNRIYRYDVRAQRQDWDIHALTRDGLSVQLKITVLFNPVPQDAGLLHQTVGPDFITRIVRPIVIGAVRDVVGKYDPHDLYRTSTEQIELNILSGIQDAALRIGLIDYRRVIVRELILPPTLDAAITRKLTEQQHALAYQYLIEQSKQEAERKRVEAIGIQTFYSIVANALSPQLLTWRGIEATVQIARSNNAKVVIVGGGKDQMPLILGSDIATQPSLPVPPTVDPQAHPLPSFDNLPSLFPDLRSGSAAPETRQTGTSSGSTVTTKSADEKNTHPSGAQTTKPAGNP